MPISGIDSPNGFLESITINFDKSSLQASCHSPSFHPHPHSPQSHPNSSCLPPSSSPYPRWPHWILNFEVRKFPLLLLRWVLSWNFSFIIRSWGALISFLRQYNKNYPRLLHPIPPCKHVFPISGCADDPSLPLPCSASEGSQRNIILCVDLLEVVSCPLLFSQQ